MLRLLSLAASAACALADTYEVTMRDGVTLHTEVDLPPFHPAIKPITAVLERSPYGVNAEELIADVFGETLGASTPSEPCFPPKPPARLTRSPRAPTPLPPAVRLGPPGHSRHQAERRQLRSLA